MSDDHSSPYGTLYLVPTPIGNPEDISLRALSILQSVSVVAAEDTRKALWLLKHLDIKVQVLSCRQQNEASRAAVLIRRLSQGQDIAFVCDAGTPGVSDPGSALTAAVSEAGYHVVALPGPSAVSMAVSLAGFGGGGYHFLGFLPRSRKKRGAQLRALVASRLPLVLFESPRRIRELLAVAAEVLGQRRAVLCRELTKTHEEVLRGTFEELGEALPSEPLGEMTLVIEGAGAGADEDASGEEAESVTEALKEHARARAAELLGMGLSRSETARQLSAEMGDALDRRSAHRLTLDIEAPSREHAPRSVCFSVQGHPDLRASHGKTVEFKRASELDRKETCVAGVGADWDPVALKGLSGRVRVGIRAGEHEDALEADICPRFRSGERMVLRKSARPDDATICVRASKGAAQLSRDLAAALADPDTRATVTITEIREED